ncbi:mcm2 3 5 family protein [Stylonychia lemnae]|uniref:DNA helicase n=1 Tax=Stylonychia lemnae TaxID=5949 RepID=A0A078A6E1_STYLE|nr:mcm2 3 5 family protein [Stylonychia lemnae]|eukprot:CDW77769.1 mcm2 3 5 family protein [Stylonychia lemnae]
MSKPQNDNKQPNQGGHRFPNKENKYQYQNKNSGSNNSNGNKQAKQPMSRQQKYGKDKPKTKLEGIQCSLLANYANDIMDYLLKKYYEQLIPILMGEDLVIYYDITVEVKKNLDVKLSMVPPTKEIVAESIRQVTSEHLNKFIILFGTVVRTGHVHSRELFKKFQCRQCNSEFTCESDITEFNRFQLPQRCDGKVQTKMNPFFKIAKTLMNQIKYKNKKGEVEINTSQNQPNTDLKTSQCKNKAFQPVDGTSEFCDYQEIKLQELFKTLKPGLIPRSMVIILQNTLVEVCKPGDDVMITGILIQRWKNMPPAPGTRPYIELALVANNVEVLNKREFSKSNQINMDTLNEFKRFWRKYDPIVGRQILLRSICPNLYERYDVKLGLLLTLIGGVPQYQEKNNFKVRGQIHMLMVGEPGTGKSQLLQCATHLSQRSVQTTGIGTTSAGLTVACFKDGAEYILEAGALVLADCGVCCIDEFSLIKPEDRASIHEAMEQQSISIAKAGIVCKINTRTTIIAATNPGKTQKWDPNYDLQQNTGIMSSLLSRFDLIFIMLDEHQAEDDLQKASFILNKACLHQEKDSLSHQIWPQEKLTDYINFVQKVFEPVVTEEAEILLKAYFAYLRMNPKVNKDRKTVRMLESIIRMTEAHARLLMKSQATCFDAICVIIVMEHSLMTNLFGMDGVPSVMIKSVEAYQLIKNELCYRLGLDTERFGEYDQQFELEKKCQTPSPIKRIEDSLFINNTATNLDISAYAGSEFSYISQDESSQFFRTNSQLFNIKASQHQNKSGVPNNFSVIGRNNIQMQQQVNENSNFKDTQLQEGNLSKCATKYLDTTNPILEERSSDMLQLDELGSDELNDLLDEYSQSFLVHDSEIIKQLEESKSQQSHLSSLKLSEELNLQEQSQNLQLEEEEEKADLNIGYQTQVQDQPQQLSSQQNINQTLTSSLKTNIKNKLLTKFKLDFTEQPDQKQQILNDSAKFNEYQHLKDKKYSQQIAIKEFQDEYSSQLEKFELEKNLIDDDGWGFKSANKSQNEYANEEDQEDMNAHNDFLFD